MAKCRAARAIHRAWSNITTETTPEETLRDVVSYMADVLAYDNPRFDRTKFIKACETGRYKG